MKTGDYLGRYRIVRKIGEGGMGAVFRATDRLTGSDVAVKRLSVRKSEELRDVMTEMNIMKSVSSPNDDFASRRARASVSSRRPSTSGCPCVRTSRAAS